MKKITEDIIKKFALYFLRQHYRNRVRDDRHPVEAKFDLEAAGGIIADGYYSFVKPNGKRFIATFEATDAGKKDEVVYKQQWLLLFWDALAMSSLGLAAIALLNYIFKFHELVYSSVFARTTLSMLVLAGLMGIYYLIAQNFTRYRYIYALEQFKKYYADEQWIAISHDVFESFDDPALRQLNRQCIRNGVGLLLIDENLDAKILIAPSRNDLFKGKRKALNFQQQDTKDLAPTADNSWFFLQPFSSKGRSNKSIYRYRKSYVAQPLLTMLGLFLTTVIFHAEWQHMPLQKVSKEELRDRIASSRFIPLPETEDFIVDSAQWRSELDADKDWYVPATDQGPIRGSQPIDLREYPCERYNNFKEPKYLIEQASVNTRKEAIALHERLQRNGMESDFLPWGCFVAGKGGFVLFTGMVYENLGEAERNLSALQKKNPALTSKWKVRPLMPMRS